MAVVIGFDTATEDTAVASMRDGELLLSLSMPPRGDGRPAHATQLLAAVEEAAESAGGWAEVERIAVGVGPGSFTGLRIGIATAKGLAQGLGVELVGVGTLEALARGAAAADRPVLAALDARRGELFAALYGPGGEPIWQPFVAAPSELGERVEGFAEAPLAVGSGTLRFRDELRGSRAAVPPDADPVHRIAPRQVCELGALAPAGADGVAPIYLRAPDAERWRERDGTES